MEELRKLLNKMSHPTHNMMKAEEVRLAVEQLFLRETAAAYQRGVEDERAKHAAN